MPYLLCPVLVYQVLCPVSQHIVNIAFVFIELVFDLLLLLFGQVLLNVRAILRLQLELSRNLFAANIVTKYAYGMSNL